MPSGLRVRLHWGKSMKQKRIFVTGANGLLGRAVLDALLEQGHHVVAMTRQADALNSYPQRAQLTLVTGDMLKVEGFANHLQGCDAVIHLAAFHREYLEGSGKADLLERVNVSGTMELIRAAENAGIARFVYVSSAGVMKRSRTPADETTAFETSTRNGYFASKVRAEHAIDQYLATRRPQMKIVIARPSMILGPQDCAPTVAGTFVRNFIEEKNAVVLPGYAVVIDARDVAAALIAMLTVGDSGERFVLGGERFSFLELNQRLERISGVAMPKPRPSYLVALAVMALRGMLGLEVPLAASEIRYMQRLKAPSRQKMRDKLGVDLRPIDETLTATIAWFKAHPSQD